MFMLASPDFDHLRLTVAGNVDGILLFLITVL